MRFERMPFGIRCACDVLQKRNQEIFGDIPGVYCTVDDLLLAADADEEHDEILSQVLVKAEDNNVKFNPQKFQYKVSTVMYLGYIISGDGISPDPDKIQAITRFPVTKDKAGLRRYLGMVKFLAQYIPNESTITAPLRRLICDNVQWEWQGEQGSAMAAINSLLTSAPVLAPSDVSKDVCVQADASLAGLGACLM